MYEFYNLLNPTGHVMHQQFNIQQLYVLLTLYLYVFYEGHLESNERFAIQSYLLIIGKKQNMQVLSHTFTYFST